ncbi:AraC family transcriptional regulator [Rhizobium sp. SG570]|uniref:helix-turn-helix domain-containing protein n=1 Tax=Rhizobium sp. SG570 TaxID=2587113 RepID=UPI0014484231|nr:AraC family transcriptional regulator [Rhizobium sp. SG570]NKJ36499.1 AraC-like DNA-binding protein [Rhizobium sp. SG570]
MPFQTISAERVLNFSNVGGISAKGAFPDAVPYVSEIRPEQVTKPTSGGLAPWQVKRVTAHIDTRLYEKLCLDGLAELAKLSTSYFSAAFKRSVGTSPHVYITTRRVERAKQLIADGMPLCEVALECGLADQAHLSRVFRRVAATTPTAWRQKQKRLAAARIAA